MHSSRTLLKLFWWILKQSLIYFVSTKVVLSIAHLEERTHQVTHISEFGSLDQNYCSLNFYLTLKSQKAFLAAKSHERNALNFL